MAANYLESTALANVRSFLATTADAFVAVRLEQIRLASYEWLKYFYLVVTLGSVEFILRLFERSFLLESVDEGLML